MIKPFCLEGQFVIKKSKEGRRVLKNPRKIKKNWRRVIYCWRTHFTLCVCGGPAYIFVCLCVSIYFPSLRLSCVWLVDTALAAIKSKWLGGQDKGNSEPSCQNRKSHRWFWWSIVRWESFLGLCRFLLAVYIPADRFSPTPLWPALVPLCSGIRFYSLYLYSASSQ